MDKYIIVGVDTMLNDICDVIHAHGGKVAAVFQNMPEGEVKRGPTIARRVEMLGYPVDLHDSLDKFSIEKGYKYVQGLNSVQKYKMVEALQAEHDIEFESLVHPEAYVGSNVTLGEGVFVNARAVIAPNAHLDDFCSVNRLAVVGHDAYVGKYTRLGPSVALAGSVTIGSHCSICISSTIIDYVEVGDWTVIGAGAVVSKDIPAGKVAVGAPARVIKSNEARGP
jgi:sugar O-acyltransferase (sialic acid O-acetyltransferase NeuD family)